MFLADLHIHSTFSDGKLSIPEIVDLYGSRGFGAIAITDHLCETNTLMGKAAVYMNRTLTPATFPLYAEILRTEAERARTQYGMVLIPGIELTKSSVVNHSSARILGLGLTEFLSADADVRTLAREIRARGGVAVAGFTPHLWDRRIELASEFDAWEISGGRHVYTDVKDSHLPKIAASGMHHPRSITSWKTVFTCEKTAEAILEAIKRQDLSFMFFTDGGSNDVSDWIDVSGARPGDERAESLRHVVVPSALSAGLRRPSLDGDSAARVHSEAAEGRRKRYS